MTNAYRAVLFFLAGALLIGAAAPREGGTGFVAGQFMIKDSGPLANGLAFFFNDATGPAPSETKYWRVPDHVSALDGNGRFSVELPSGKYYIGGIKRLSGKQHIGPPEEGDLFLGSRGSEGKPIPAYVVKTGERTDVGILSGASPFRRAVVQYGPGITAIAGSLSLIAFLPDDEFGKALAANANRYSQYKMDSERLRSLGMSSRSRGYVVSENLFHEGVTSIGVPIINSQGAIVAAITVSTIGQRMPLKRREAIAKFIKKVAAPLVAAPGGRKKISTR